MLRSCCHCKQLLYSLSIHSRHPADWVNTTHSYPFQAHRTALHNKSSSSNRRSNWFIQNELHTNDFQSQCQLQATSKPRLQVFETARPRNIVLELFSRREQSVLSTTLTSLWSSGWLITQKRLSSSRCSYVWHWHAFGQVHNMPLLNGVRIIMTLPCNFCAVSFFRHSADCAGVVNNVSIEFV